MLKRNKRSDQNFIKERTLTVTKADCQTKKLMAQQLLKLTFTSLKGGE